MNQVKNQFNEYRGLMKFLSTSLIVLITSSLFLIVWMYFYNPLMRYSPLYSNGLILLVGVYSFIYITFTNVYNGYKIGHLRITDIIYSQFTSIVLVNLITYVEVSLMDRQLLNPMMFIILTIIQIIMVVFWAFLSNRIYYRIFKPLRVLLLHGESDPLLFINKINKRNDKFNIEKVKYINDFTEHAIELIPKYETVFLFDIDSELRNKLLKVCYSNQIPCYITPKITDIIVGSSDWIHLFDTPLFLSKNINISAEQKFIKRIFDVIISSILIFTTLPISFIIALIIRFSDGGNPFYKQQRLTLNNRVFDIYKFRSMIIEAEAENEPQLAKKDDNRITKVGQFIRKTRIDELPQLFNILKGDMSFVGPRPERPELVDKYLEDFPEFAYRTRVKAGLTGYAQIMGKYNTSIYDKLKLDLMYIENFSLLLDLKIMLATIKYVITPANEESSEGFDE